jgi:hypothetical protein
MLAHNNQTPFSRMLSEKLVVSQLLTYCRYKSAVNAKRINVTGNMAAYMHIIPYSADSLIYRKI